MARSETTPPCNRRPASAVNRIDAILMTPLIDGSATLIDIFILNKRRRIEYFRLLMTCADPI
jgi:hypothetical protein